MLPMSATYAGYRRVAHEGCFARTTRAACGSASTCRGRGGRLGCTHVTPLARLATRRIRIADGKIINLSRPIVMLHARCRRERVHNASFWRHVETVIHHATAPPEAIGAIPVTVIETPLVAAFMAKPRGADAPAPCLALGTRANSSDPRGHTASRGRKPADSARRRRLRIEVNTHSHIPGAGTGENLVRGLRSCESRSTTHVPVVEGSVLNAPRLHFLASLQPIISRRAKYRQLPS